MDPKLTRYHPRDLLLEWLPYGVTRPQRPLPAGHGMMCAATKQRGIDNQVPCGNHAKVAAWVKDVHDRAAGEFPLCGSHARLRSVFVVPGARLV